MILLLAVVLGIATAPLLGGRLSRLCQIHLAAQPVLLAALLLQVLAASAQTLPQTWLRAAHLLSYVLAGLFVWANRRLRGVVALGIGGVLNGAAIAATGGVMPAAHEAVAAAGLTHAADRLHNSAVVEDAQLAFLGDVFSLPAGMPLANVFSVGDIVLFVAGILIVHGLTGASAVLLRERLGARPMIGALARVRTSALHG